MSPGRVLYAVVLVAMVGFLGWRVIAAELDRRAPPFESTAAERLSRDPLDGDAFSDLAVEMRTTSTDQAAILEMHRIAARRDPRDLRIRAWLVDHHLRAAEYGEVMVHLDIILRLDPELRATLMPMMVTWAGDPAFATVLAAKLDQDPTWLPAMLAALRKDIAHPGSAAVFAALRESGTLDEAQTGYWLDALINSGNWELAHRHWARGLSPDGSGEVPLLYNGGFERKPTNQGFDWRTGRRSGSYTEFEPADGAEGQAAHLVFSGRPVDMADLEQALALPAGSYALTMRLRAVALRSDQGLRWTITCHGQSRPIATGEPIEGTFGWRGARLAVDVPAEGCPGQWLRLDNPAPSGSASSVSGELWVDAMDVAASATDLRSPGGP